MKKILSQKLIAFNMLFLMAGIWSMPNELQAQESDNSTLRRSNDELIVFNRSEVVSSDEVIRNAVVIGGDIQVDGRIERDLIVVGGSVTLNGEIGGDLTLIGGKLIAGADAMVEHEGILIGGPFVIDSHATFDEDLFQFPLPGLFSFISGIKLWMTHCFILMRPFAISVTWTMVLAGLLVLVNFLTLILLGNAVDQSVKVLEPKPITTFFVGLLGLILLGPLLLLVTATGVGILLVPFFICAISAATIVGKVAVYTTLGKRIGHRAGANWGNTSIAAFLIGSLIMFLFYLVPFLGGLALGVVLPLAFGAILLAAIQMFRAEVDFPAPISGKPLVVQPSDAGAAISHSEEASKAQEEPQDNEADGVNVTSSKETPHREKKRSTVTKPPSYNSEQTHAGQYERAGFWARIAATALDFVLVFFGLQILGLIDGQGGFRYFILLWMVYHIVLWGWKGTTVGGTIMKLKLVTLKGEAPLWGTVVIRSLSSLFSGIPLGLGFLWVGWNAERQSWHDLVAGTVIIRTQEPKAVFA
tara:strand:- start:542 stop:2125 length:1584 start_codon:yes stop_codon:yes gene_type:complete